MVRKAKDLKMNGECPVVLSTKGLLMTSFLLRLRRVVHLPGASSGIEGGSMRVALFFGLG